MISRLTSLRARLHVAGPVLFAQTMIPDPTVSSIIGSCGFDFVMIDAEHGPFGADSLRACIEAVQFVGTSAVVRVPSHNPVDINQALDLGARGIMVPRIESREETLAAIHACRYPPAGSRGVSRAVRAARFGLDVEYFHSANQAIATIAIIESARGVERAGDIASVAGLDAILVGADDLSADLGHFGDYEHPIVASAIESVIEAARNNGVKVGGRRPRSAGERDGMLIGCANDTVLLRTEMERALQRGREHATPAG